MSPTLTGAFVTGAKPILDQGTSLLPADSAVHLYIHICSLTAQVYGVREMSSAEETAPAGHKASKADGDDGRLGAANKHDVGLALADVVGSRHEGVVGGGAGRGDGVVGAHEACVNGHQRAAPAARRPN